MIKEIQFILNRENEPGLYSHRLTGLAISFIILSSLILQYNLFKINSINFTDVLNRYALFERTQLLDFDGLALYC